MGAWILRALIVLCRHLSPLLLAELLKRAPEIVSAIVARFVNSIKKPKESERPTSEEKINEILEANKKEVEGESIESIVAQSNAHFSKPGSGSGTPQDQ